MRACACECECESAHRRRVARRSDVRPPARVDPEAEPSLSINTDAHEPVHGERCAHRAEILELRRAAGGDGRVGDHIVAELREGGDEIVMVILERVLGLADIVGDLVRELQICGLLALVERAQQLRGRAEQIGRVGQGNVWRQRHRVLWRKRELERLFHRLLHVGLARWCAATGHHLNKNPWCVLLLES